MKVILDKLLEQSPDGLQAQLTFKNGFTVQGAVKRAEILPDVKDTYQILTSVLKQNGQPTGQMVLVYFQADELFNIAQPFEPKIITPDIRPPTNFNPQRIGG